MAQGPSCGLSLGLLSGKKKTQPTEEARACLAEARADDEAAAVGADHFLHCRLPHCMLV